MYLTKRPFVVMSILLLATVFLLTACAPATPTISPARLTEIAQPSATPTAKVQVIENTPTLTPTPPPSVLVDMVPMVSPLCEASFEQNEDNLPKYLYGRKISGHDLMAVAKDVVFPEQGWKEIIISPELMAAAPQDVKYLVCVRTVPFVVGTIFTSINGVDSSSDLLMTNWAVHLVNPQDGAVLLSTIIITDAPTPLATYQISYSRDGRYYGARPSVDVLDSWLLDMIREGVMMVKLEESGYMGGLNYSSALWPDSETFAQFMQDGLTLWELETGKVINQIDLGFIQDGSTQIQMIPNRKSLVTYATGVYDPIVVNIWNVENGELEFSLIEGGEKIRSIAVSPNGQSLATGDKQGNLRLWSLVDGQLIEKWTLQAIIAMAFSPDGKTMAISLDESVMLLDIASGSTRPLDVYSNAWGVLSTHFAFSADGNTLAVWYPDQVSIWDLSSGQKRADIFPESVVEKIVMVALSPDGSFLATGMDRDKNILILWDPENGSILRSLLKHPFSYFEGEIPQFLTFSPDGKDLILGTIEDSVSFLLRTWELP